MLPSTENICLRCHLKTHKTLSAAQIGNGTYGFISHLWLVVVRFLGLLPAFTHIWVNWPKFWLHTKEEKKKKKKLPLLYNLQSTEDFFFNSFFLFLWPVYYDADKKPNVAFLCIKSFLDLLSILSSGIAYVNVFNFDGPSVLFWRVLSEEVHNGCLIITAILMVLFFTFQSSTVRGIWVFRPMTLIGL